ncbi:SDR family oxidoreductase [Embleya hyalina]|uniref:dTDP-4-dehydrorhamnose reductase n=1 Tax=Embleya hyalina TaxID=516124 RepID=A0A401YJC4_9ACTN|nr:sugar nucleotide-binding protein [Embleya hyalina]GCD94703.1 dTDP-4-dehydrorhamnose reductase [Embleya hyalina]
MTVLIIGGSGFLGTELVRQAAASSAHATAATFSTRPGGTPRVPWHALDLRDPARIEALMAEVQPRVVINATSGGPDWPITAEGPIRLAMAAANHGSRLVHVSSDAVFSGAHVHYDESCLPDPLTPYGAAKAAAETGIRLVNPKAIIARTSLIIGDRRSEHVRAVHDLAAGTRTGVLFTDDIRCPIHVTDLAAALLELAHGDRSGIHHLAGPDAISRHELGTLIAERDNLDPTRLPKGRRAATTLPGPLDVRLDSQATQATLQTVLRGAHQFLTTHP